MLDKSRICEKYLKILGKGMRIIYGDGSEDSVFAILQQLWSKNKTKFEDNQFEVGKSFNEYYTYIGPASCNVSLINENGYIICDGIKYALVRSNPIKVGRHIQFYSAVFKRIWEGDYNAFI